MLCMCALRVCVCVVCVCVCVCVCVMWFANGAIIVVARVFVKVADIRMCSFIRVFVQSRKVTRGGAAWV